MRRAVSLLTFMMMLFVAGSAAAVNVTINLQFRDISGRGPFPDAALAGWRITVRTTPTDVANDLNGVPVPLLTTDATGKRSPERKASALATTNRAT